jgi:hypothetical protein
MVCVLLGSLLAAGCGAPDGLDGDDTSVLAEGVKANGPIEIDTAKQGVRFTDWGLDIKQSCSQGADPCVPPVAKKLAADPAWAAEIFGSGRMNVLRIPIRADGKGVDGSGSFDPSYYGIIVQAAKNALAVNPNIRIFASRSTVSDCPNGDPSCMDFAESLKEGGKASGKVLMWKYGRLLGQYLTWFDAQGVHVDILGPDNEPTNNEGQLSITRIEDAMKSLDEHYDKSRPKLMLNDGSKPDIEFLEKVDALGKWPLVGFAGTHYQSDERATRHDLLDEFAAFARHQGHKQVWDTEYHFTDNKPNDDKPGVLGEFADAALGVYGIFDQLDAGLSGIVWWSYRPPSEGTSKSEIQTALVETIGGAFPLATSDGDGPASRRSSLNTRAVHQGKDVVLWVVNDSGYDYPQKPIVLRKENGSRIQVKSAPTWERWKRVDPTGGAMSHSNGVGKVVKGNASVAYPPNSITVVRIADVY